jgi:hypothetical protein
LLYQEISGYPVVDYKNDWLPVRLNLH